MLYPSPSRLSSPFSLQYRRRLKDNGKDGERAVAPHGLLRTCPVSHDRIKDSSKDFSQLVRTHVLLVLECIEDRYLRRDTFKGRVVTEALRHTLDKFGVGRSSSETRPHFRPSLPHGVMRDQPPWSLSLRSPSTPVTQQPRSAGGEALGHGGGNWRTMLVQRLDQDKSDMSEQRFVDGCPPLYLYITWSCLRRPPAGTVNVIHDCRLKHLTFCGKIMTEYYYPVRMPTILHGYTINREQFSRLGRHIVDDEFYETYMDDDDGPPDEHTDEPTPLEMYFYYLHGLSKEDRARAPRLFPINLTSKEETEYERQLEENEATAVSPKRYLLVTHRSKLEPGGKVREAAAVETERAKKILDDFLAFVVPDAPHVLSAKDFKWAHAPRGCVTCGSGVLLDHFPFIH
ncbi:hypothetical protein FISHEDRAFT_73241 [Fistulina hepatica ATCC 64428]|uniref:Uncharacterized protein n=1 Tax=Fistulina hepatica ATCC 64428 TaxID=1128425 RepID=A0A0D7ACZ6_9AGAR|nr:hypothetical protein FISHEDRAFT_73241 [Fistulina hepatica ATCC 64428]